MFCPYCESEQDVSKVVRRETLSVLGEPVDYDAELYKCTGCNNEFATTELEEENFRKAYNIYRDRHHLLRPEKIREIRRKYVLSQKDFSRFLGWGEITIHRYESGSLQDVVHNEALALIEDPRNALKIFEMNKDRLSPGLSQRIEKTISELLSEKRETLLLPLIEQDRTEVTIETGYKAFDLGKIENLILYIAARCEGVLKTKLNKLLWYIEFKHFKGHTVGITGTRYLHLPLGPVPEDYELFTYKLQLEDRLEAQEEIIGDYVGEKYIAKEEPDLSLFSKEELETINLVIEKLGSLGSKAIKDLSHKEAAYRMTAHREVIPYSFAKDLSI